MTVTTPISEIACRAKDIIGQPVFNIWGL